MTLDRVWTTSHDGTEAAGPVRGSAVPRPPIFEMHEAPTQSGLELAVRGEVDMTTADQLKRRLERAAALKEPVVLDLEACTFMDSSGLRVLVAARAGADRDGWTLTITRPSTPVARLLDIAGMTDLVLG